MILMLKKAVSISLLLVMATGSVFVARRLGLRPDPRMVEFLNSPSTVESFTKSASHKADETWEAKSPLVVQAEVFALYLDPPEPPKRIPPPPRARVARLEVTPIAAAVSPKFRGVGISYHRSKPAESRALVWQAGSGLSWVAQDAKLGRMVVRRINRDSIEYEDVAGLHEMALELDATQIMLAQKPQDRQEPRENDKIVAVGKMEVLPDREELPPFVEADMNEPHIEEPVPVKTEPKQEPSPTHTTPWRRPRPIRPVARRKTRVSHLLRVAKTGDCDEWHTE